MNLLRVEITMQMMCRYFTPCRPCFYHPHKMSQIKDVVLHSAWSLSHGSFYSLGTNSISAICHKPRKCALFRTSALMCLIIWPLYCRGGPTFATARRIFVDSVHLDVWYCHLHAVLLETRSMHSEAMTWDFCGSRNAFWKGTMKSRRRSARLSSSTYTTSEHAIGSGESSEQDFEPFTCKIWMKYYIVDCSQHRHLVRQKKKLKTEVG